MTLSHHALGTQSTSARLIGMPLRERRHTLVQANYCRKGCDQVWFLGSPGGGSPQAAPRRIKKGLLLCGRTRLNDAKFPFLQTIPAALGAQDDHKEHR